MGKKAFEMLIETFNRLKLEDPMKGTWLVSNSRNGTVWCDASSIALGVVMEIDGNLVEDTAWLRKKTILPISSWPSWTQF